MLRLFGLCTVAISVGVLSTATAAAPKAAPADVQAVTDKAYNFLKSRQAADGSFAAKFGGPGITALTTAALLKSGRAPDDPVVAKSLKYLESFIKPDGGIYDRGLANYTTCIAIMAFAEANEGGKYDQVIEKAAKFIRTLQYGDVAATDSKYGGTGYDGRSRPDLSNTQFFIDALVASGAAKDDPALQKALAFVGRSQNLPGESNELAFAKKAGPEDTGGFVYNLLDADDEKSKKRTPTGGLRSEGAMTYAGLKSFLYAGVGKEDRRVKAALNWIRKHYSLEQNPGQGTAGLFYYYQTFAKAMAALGEDEFTDANGKKHVWRQELFQTLKAKQKPDGSWANDNRAFLENQPELATAFALLAISYSR